MNILDLLFQTVAEVYGLLPGQVTAPKGQKRITYEEVRARRLFCYLAWQLGIRPTFIAVKIIVRQSDLWRQRKDWHRDSPRVRESTERQAWQVLARLMQEEAGKL